jgi:hypothetical protein
MESAIKRNRRKAALFKALSGWAAGIGVLAVTAEMVLGQAGSTQLDEWHVNRHDARGAVFYLTDLQERIDLIAICVLIAAFAIGLALALASLWFRRREDQETQKQLLSDEFGPKNSN